MEGAAGVHVACSAAMRAIAVRVGKWALLTFVAMEVLYLIAANTLLRTRILRDHINHDPTRMDLEYESAWSLLPGVVHVRQLTIRGRGDGVEWWLHIDQAKFRVGLFDLCRARFHTSYTNVDGLDLHIRLRLRPEEALPDVVAALPDIEGFANPPLRDPPKAQAEPEGADWTLDLEDIDLHHARDVWIHSMRYVGGVNVRGRWAMAPDKRLEVGPAHVEMSDLVASYGKVPIGTAIHGVADVTIDDVAIDSADVGPPVLHALSVSAVVTGQGHTSAGLSRLMGVDGLRLVSGDGPTQGEVHIVRGVIVARTLVFTELSGVNAHAGQEDLAFAMKASANFERTDVGLAHPRLVLSETDVEITDLALAHADLGVIARAPLAALRTGSLSMAHGEGAQGNVDMRVPNVALADVSRFRKLLGSSDSFVLEHGASTAMIGLDVDAATLALQGEVSLHAPALTVKIKERTMSVDLGLRIVAKRAGNETELSTSRIAINESRAGGANQDGRDSAAWFVYATMDKASLALEPSARLVGKFSGAARDASPGGFFVQAVTTLPQAVGSASKSGRVDFRGTVAATGTMLALQNFEAVCGAASARVSYCRDKAGAVGDAVVGAAGAHVTIDLSDGPAAKGRDRGTPRAGECSRSPAPSSPVR